MSDKNTVEQVVKLNTKDYTDGTRKVQNSVKQMSTSVAKDLDQVSRGWISADKEAKEASNSIASQAKKVGDEIKKNIVNGAIINAGVSASNFVRNGVSQSAKAILTFGEAMSRVQLKTGMTKKSVDDLQDSLTQFARTGASLQSIPDAFDEIFSSVGDVEKSKGVLETISGFSKGVEGRDAAGVAKFVRGTLTSENQPLSKSNTEQLLSSVATMMKAGAFKNLNEAMAAFAGLNTGSMSNISMGNRSAAGMLSAASGVANKEQSLAAINEIIKGAGNGFAGNAVLSGILGANLIKNGKIDTQALGQASDRYKSKGFSDAGFKQLLTSSGLSEDAANGLVNILKNADKFSAGIKKFEDSSITAAQAGDMLGNNISGKIEDAFEGILASFTNFFNHLTSMDIGKALSDILKHPMEILGSLGLLGGGYAVTSFAAKRVLGVVGGQAAAASAGGGAAAVGAGGMTAAESAAIFGGGGAAAATGAGLAATLGVGAVGIGAGVLGGSKLSAMQESYIANHPGSEAARRDAQLTELIGSISQLVGLLPEYAQPRKHTVEIQSKDPGFVAVPKSSDNQRDPRGP